MEASSTDPTTVASTTDVTTAAYATDVEETAKAVTTTDEVDCVANVKDCIIVRSHDWSYEACSQWTSTKDGGRVLQAMVDAYNDLYRELYVCFSFS